MCMFVSDMYLISVMDDINHNLKLILWHDFLFRMHGFAFQLNTVDAGGATVFINLNITVPVVKVNRITI